MRILYLLHNVLNQCTAVSYLCSHQFLYSGHFRNVRVDPQLQFILLMQNLFHLHMYSLKTQTPVLFLYVKLQKQLVSLVTYLILSGHRGQVILQPPVLSDGDLFVSPETNQLLLGSIQLSPQAAQLPLPAVQCPLQLTAMIPHYYQQIK